MQLNQLAEFKAHPRHAQAVKFSNDGSELVTTGMDALAQVWSVPEFECLRTMDGHEQSVNAVDLSPDGRLAITGSTDRKVMVWEWDSCEVLHTMGGYPQHRRGRGLLSNGRGCGDSLIRWQDRLLGRRL